MISSDERFDGQSGAAARHVFVVLILGMVCFFGVKAFYSRVENGVSDSPEQSPRPAASEALGSGQLGDDRGEIDKEAITRRNLFLAGNSEGNSDISSLLNGSGVNKVDLLLVGTIVESGGVNRAVVLDVEQKKQHLLREGDMINGASVRRIDSGRVTISRQGRNELLDITEAEKVRATTTELTALDNTDNKQREPVSVTTEQNQDNETEESPLRVDLERLGEMSGGVIIKGRTSDNI